MDDLGCGGRKQGQKSVQDKLILGYAALLGLAGCIQKKFEIARSEETLSRFPCRIPHFRRGRSRLEKQGAIHPPRYYLSKEGIRRCHWSGGLCSIWLIGVAGRFDFN